MRKVFGVSQVISSSKQSTSCSVKPHLVNGRHFFLVSLPIRTTKTILYLEVRPTPWSNHWLALIHSTWEIALEWCQASHESRSDLGMVILHLEQSTLLIRTLSFEAVDVVHFFVEQTWVLFVVVIRDGARKVTKLRSTLVKDWLRLLVGTMLVKACSLYGEVGICIMGDL